MDGNLAVRFNKDVIWELNPHDKPEHNGIVSKWHHHDYYNDMVAFKSGWWNGIQYTIRLTRKPTPQEVGG